MKRLETILPKRAIVRVSLALAMAFVILACAAYATIQITRSQLREYADRLAEQQSGYVNVVTNMTFVGGAWVINSFMAGFSDVECLSIDSASHLPVTRCVMSDETLRELTVNEIYEKMESFINYHYDYASVKMIFEPGVISDAPHGIAAKVKSGDTVRYNLLNELNVFDSGFYKEIKDSGSFVSHAGFLAVDSLFTSTIGVPIFDMRGNIVGEFWVDTDANTYSELLNLYRSDDGVVLAIINSDCRIVASCNKQNNGKWLKDVSVESCGSYFPARWYSTVMSHMKLKKASHFRYKIGGDFVVTYVFPVRSSDYNLLIVKPETAVYSAVQRFIWLPIVILVVSILLVSLCLIYIFFVFRRQNNESARMKGELSVAAEIQRKILPPNPTNPTANCQLQPYDIFGYQKSAKTVGGDLYDFVQKGDYLHFCIGDVSGKGMPAALVMSEICSLYRYIIWGSTDPADIVTRMNKALMERSDDSVFCTLFVGVLNLRTGLLQYCNAGHNPPIYIPASSTHNPQPSTFLKVKPNIMLYAFDDYVYQPESLQLHPGDRLYLYTDGVTEAQDESNHFFGNEATLASVERLKSEPFDKLVHGVLANLKTFTRKAEQYDDITMLCVEFKGSTLHFDAVKGQVSVIVNAVIDACNLTEDMRLRLAIEEPVQNISDYAYEDDGPLDVSVVSSDTDVKIVLIDSGKPFNPLEEKTPDLNVPIEQRKIGGLGIFLTRKVMSDVAYSYENGKNKLTLKYKLPK